MRIFGFGANSSGQLGLGCDSENQNITELQLDFLQEREIKSLSCGGSHTLMIDGNGDIWATGKNHRGQLGDGTVQSKNSFVKVECAVKFQKSSCGWDCSAAFTSDQRLFVWGSNATNQLGFNQDVKTVLSPREFMLPAEWGKPVELKFGLRFTAILTDSNRIFITGSLKTFKSSLSPHYQFVSLFNDSCEYLSYELKVNNFACGQNHVLIQPLNTPSVVIGFGDNKFGQCEKRTFDGRIKVLKSGWTHCCALFDNGELYSWGRNCYGQLGIGFKSDGCINSNQLKLELIDDFSLGSEHGILHSQNRVFTWGWNEHSNCGTGDFEDVLIPKHIMLPYDFASEKVVNVYAGAGFCLVLVDSQNVRKVV